LRGSVIWWRGG